ncbi:hypothetical protein BC832DRAFT_217527 [Gaertneriomyces semiglobifer]|nr:hypothetical protein BC832DRAFT_217527 [Gaertneriomyces semiglobifer]
MSWKDPCNKYFARTPVNEISVSAWFKEVTADLSLEDVVASTAADWYSRFNAHRPAGVKSDQEFKVLKSLWTDRDDALAAVRQSSAISLTTIAAKHDRLKDCISSRNKRKNEEEGVMAQHEKRTRLPVPSQATDDTSRVKPHDGTSQIPGKRTEVEMLPSSHPVHSEMVESQSAMSNCVNIWRNVPFF